MLSRNSDVPGHTEVSRYIHWCYSHLDALVQIQGLSVKVLDYLYWGKGFNNYHFRLTCHNAHKAQKLGPMVLWLDIECKQLSAGTIRTCKLLNKNKSFKKEEAVFLIQFFLFFFQQVCDGPLGLKMLLRNSYSFIKLTQASPRNSVQPHKQKIHIIKSKH